MRAVTVDEYGGVPHVRDMAIPRPGPNQLLVNVQAAGVNPMDLSIANGGWKDRMPATFPMVLGADVAGVVAAVGADVRHFSVGDEIFGQVQLPPLGSSGTYAESVVVPDDAPIAKVPDGMEPIVAASLPTAGGTAFEIVDSLSPLAGKTVLVVGAGGGVGSMTTQLAVNAGARLIADARASDAERMRRYGATETIDYTTVSVPATVQRDFPDGVDVLIDVASDRDAFASLATLVRRGGTALTTKNVADVDTLALNGINGVNFIVKLSSELLGRLVDEVAAGTVVAAPIRRVRLEDAPAMLSEMSTGHAQGKTVVIP